MEKFCITVKAGRCLQALQNKVKKNKKNKTDRSSQVSLLFFFPVDRVTEVKKATPTQQSTRFPTATRVPRRRRKLPVSRTPPGLLPKSPRPRRTRGRRRTRTRSSLSSAPASPSTWPTSIPPWSSRPSQVRLEFVGFVGFSHVIFKSYILRKFFTKSHFISLQVLL